MAGCDPAIFLTGEYLRRQKDRTSVVGWTMGSMAALQALQRGEVHVAGMHLFDPATGESNLPFLRRTLGRSAHEVVTFATWEEGFLVRPGNPKSLRAVNDLAIPDVTLVNREEGSGARLLLDQRLRTAGIEPTQVRGYDRIVPSHVEVARAVASRQADVGIGIRSAAKHFGLDFVPIQTARYDLVVPTSYLRLIRRDIPRQVVPGYESSGRPAPASADARNGRSRQNGQGRQNGQARQGGQPRQGDQPRQGNRARPAGNAPARGQRGRREQPAVAARPNRGSALQSTQATPGFSPLSERQLVDWDVN